MVLGWNCRNHTMDWGAGAPRILKESAKSDPTLRGILTPLDPCFLFGDAQILRVRDQQNPTVISRCERHCVTEVRVVRVLLNEGLSSVARVGDSHRLVATDLIIQQSIAVTRGTLDALTFRYVPPNRCGVGAIERRRAARHRGRF